MMTLYDIFSGSTLTHLSLHLSFDYPNSWGSSGLTNIAHFIYGFKDTLQSLQLTAFHGLSIPHWREAFEDLGYFPNLQHIELQLKIDEFVGPSVFSFLERHQAHITELSLGQLYPGVPHLNGLSLSNLRKLCLDTECSAGGLRDFWTSPIDFKSLTNLALTAPSLPSNSLSDFCKECRDSGFGDQLRYLALDMRLLNGGVFDSLSITFPLLYSLSVSYRILSNADGSGIWTSIGFMQQMEPRLYPKWRLYDMSIIQIQEDFFQPDMIMYTLMEAIARSIPTVKSFCGSGHMDFMESRVPVHRSDELH
ncbi:hypothetical protein ONZ45_g14648 [Pleurotus djamor]|nr:hypothetical protein ONZ45_g14648 [Pleurotus djamor]